ncbi:unnamed protein product [Prunus brigantina]
MGMASWHVIYGCMMDIGPPCIFFLKPQKVQNFKYLHPRVAAGPHGSYQRQSYHVTRASTLLIDWYVHA